MQRLLPKILRKVVQIIAKTDSNLPAILEVDLQHMQGKGSGGYSTEVEATMALNFILRDGQKKLVVFDIGANIGTYSEAIRRSAPAATIFAFEPSLVARQKLSDKFTGDSSVVVVPLALGSTNATQTLYSDFPGSGMASLTKRRLEHFGIDFSQTESIDVVTLDSWVESMNVVPNVIKLDVEGHELDVLKGGGKTLALTQVVQFEFGGCNIDTRTFFQDFWYLLTPLGFTIYRISTDGPIRLSRYSELEECFRTTNYLAVRE